MSDLPAATLDVSIKDRQGDVTRIERAISVKAPKVSKAGEVGRRTAK